MSVLLMLNAQQGVHDLPVPPCRNGFSFSRPRMSSWAQPMTKQGCGEHTAARLLRSRMRQLCSTCCCASEVQPATAVSCAHANPMQDGRASGSLRCVQAAGLRSHSSFHQRRRNPCGRGQPQPSFRHQGSGGVHPVRCWGFLASAPPCSSRRMQHDMQLACTGPQ
jgi:hypothetical protein